MSASKLFLHNHPVSSYAQKIRIALREKGLDFDFKTPTGLGSGQNVPELEQSNMRLEVPALVDGDVHIFDSTVIMEYLEDKWPQPALLPKDPAARAQARMIEDVVDTTYEAINWGYGEVVWFKRAEGPLEEKLIEQVKSQTGEMLKWLTAKLGDKPYFNGDAFGYADVCVGPVLNRSVHYGFGPAEGTPLQQWYARISERESCKTTFAEMVEGAKMMASGALREVIAKGEFRREYRDHRLEWMIKSGGIDVITAGLKNNSIRFSWPEANYLPLL